MLLKKRLLKMLGGAIIGAIAIGGIPMLCNYADDTSTPLVLKEDLKDIERKNNGALPTSYAPIIEQASKSVVNVYSTKIVKERAMNRHPFFNDPFFRDFFESPRQAPRLREHKEQGLGSGVIISSDGYILTNNHVVNGADEIKIALNGAKKEYKATVVGTDSKTDIALLKVDASNLPLVTVADSDKVKVGDIVFAIGNPFGVGQTVTKGIISAKGRDIGIVDYEGFLQTDAAINPGNSGGALIDATGRLVGINTAIVSRSGGSQGIGFAIPINMAKRIAKRLIESGSISRGFLGVGIQDITPELKEAFSLTNHNGALVTTVSDESSAAQAGIKAGDVIVTFDGREVKDTRELRFTVAATAPGKKVKVGVIREGKKIELSATLKAMDGTIASGGTSSGNGLLTGITFSELTNSIRHTYNIPDSIKGLLVDKIKADSKASEFGIQKGDIVLEVNHKAVTSLDDLRKTATQGNPSRLLVRIWRRGGHLFLVLKK